MDEEEEEHVPQLPLPLRDKIHEDGPLPTTRYSEMVPHATVEQWAGIFRQFDRDNGGDVDLRELGLMFRHLGQTPTEAQMMLFIEEVDIDKSGTVDFEEFCLLMMRQQRLTRCPEWLYVMLHPPLFGEVLPGNLPTTATLNDGKHDAAQRIKRHMGIGRIGANAATSSTAGGASNDSIGARPAEFSSFTRELLLSVVDLLPSAEHVKVSSIGAYD